MEAGGQPERSLQAAGLAGLGAGTGKAPSAIAFGSTAQSSATESFRASWQSMLSSLTGESEETEENAPAVEMAGESTVLTGNIKSTPSQERSLMSVAGSFDKALQTGRHAVIAAADGSGISRTSRQNSDVAHSIGWCKWSDGEKKSGAEVRAKTTPSAMSPAEPISSEPDRMKLPGTAAVDLSQSLLTLPAMEPEPQVSGASAEIALGGVSESKTAASAARVASIATAPNELHKAEPAHSFTFREGETAAGLAPVAAFMAEAQSLRASADIAPGSEAEIHATLSAARVEPAASQRFAPAPNRVIRAKQFRGLLLTRSRRTRSTWSTKSRH